MKSMPFPGSIQGWPLESILKKLETAFLWEYTVESIASLCNNGVYLLVGGALYLVGSLLVTVAFNVPKNEALAARAPTDSNAASLWADYLSAWTAWNHVRTVGSLAAAASLTIGLCY